jgi:hypothetical protein
VGLLCKKMLRNKNEGVTAYITVQFLDQLAVTIPARGLQLLWNPRKNLSPDHLKPHRQVPRPDYLLTNNPTINKTANMHQIQEEGNFMAKTRLRGSSSNSKSVE